MSDTQPGATEQTTAAAPAERSGASFFGRRRGLRSPSEQLHPDAAPPPPQSPGKPPSKRTPMLSSFSGFLSFFLVLALVALGGVAAGVKRLEAPGPLTEDTVVNIPPRTEVGDIIEQLRKANVIDQPMLFSTALLVEGKRGRVKAGEYLFRKGASLNDVMDTLVSGKHILHAITIPEGLTSEQIIERLRQNDVLAGDIRDIPAEGTLLPETYKVARGFSRNDLVRKMQADQARMLDRIWERRAADLPLRSKYELLTLASIVEKETGRADERTRVAAVFYNRLRKRMRLQSDPTIVYGLVGGKGTLGRPIQRNEILRPTRYNTYVIDGLPPGPIGNPGRAALEAVARPSQTNDLYFVADGTGGHAFADSLEQHNRNVARWRDIEKSRKTDANTPPPADVDRVDPAAGGVDVPPGRRSDLGDDAEPADTFGSIRVVLPATPHQGTQALARALADAGPRLGKTYVDGPAPAQTVPPVAAYAPVNAAPAPAAAAIARAAPVASEPPQVVAAAAPASRPDADKPAQGGDGKPVDSRFKIAPDVEALGIVVRGVNDAPVMGALDGPADDGAGGPVSTEMVPLSPAKRADMQARAAKFGAGVAPTTPLPDTPVAANPTAGLLAPSFPGVAAPRAAMANGKPRIFDASEGTRLDPLRDKSWDLNSPQTIPAMTVKVDATPAKPANRPAAHPRTAQRKPAARAPAQNNQR